jgi:hypothetical protein
MASASGSAARTTREVPPPQAELQGVPFVQDPLAIQNSFLNQDAIFLDWLPFRARSVLPDRPRDPESRSMAQMTGP